MGGQRKAGTRVGFDKESKAHWIYWAEWECWQVGRTLGKWRFYSYQFNCYILFITYIALQYSSGRKLCNQIYYTYQFSVMLGLMESQ
jgi:hypothetical protein